MKIFFVQFVYSCHLFLISSASVRSIPFLSFIEPIFAWKVPLVSLIFLKRSLVFHILLFSSISLHWSLRKAFLSLPAILWNSAFKWQYLSFSPLLFASAHFTAICKASSDSPFAFLHFFSMGMVLIPASCTGSRTSAHTSSGSLRFPCSSAGKEPAFNAGDLGSFPGLGRSPREGIGYPLQYSGLENSMCHKESKNILVGWNFGLSFLRRCWKRMKRWQFWERWRIEVEVEIHFYRITEEKILSWQDTACRRGEVTSHGNIPQWQ